MSRVSIDERATDALDTGEFIPRESPASKYFEAEPRTRMRAEVAGKTHPGLVRPNNEDHYLAVRRTRSREILATSVPQEILESTEDNAYVMAVADGLGGQKFGELASLIAMRTGWELGGDEIKWAVRLNEREVEEIRDKAEVFCQLLEESVQAEVRENPRLAGMATTLTLCYTTGPSLFIVHVGDSRAYLLRNGELSQLTRDHTLGQELLDTGEANPNSPLVRKFRHVLTNCIGGSDSKVVPDVEHLKLVDGDLLLLCTDGLNNMVSDAEIAGLLGQAQGPADACQSLIDRALKYGGKDNVTVIVARYQSDGER
jgi:protein phosphatase